jgi:hypothetical protein
MRRDCRAMRLGASRKLGLVGWAMLRRFRAGDLHLRGHDDSVRHLPMQSDCELKHQHRYDHQVHGSMTHSYRVHFRLQSEKVPGLLAR